METFERAKDHVLGKAAAILAEIAGDFLCVCRAGVIEWANPAAAALMGAACPGDLVGTRFLRLLHPDHAARLEGGIESLADDPAGRPLMMTAMDGAVIPVRIVARVLGPDLLGIAAGYLAGRGGSDPLVAAVASLEERARDLVRVSRHAALAATVFETASEGIMVLDAELRVTAVNPAFTEITGYSPIQAVGRKPPMLLCREGDPRQALLPFEAARTTGRWQGERWSRRADGERYAERLGVSAIAGEDGTILHYVVVFSDITQRKIDEEEVRRRASTDTLTGLPNRSLFLDRLNQAVHSAQRDGRMVCLMFIDLDGFKLVNDTLGHDMGDLLLQEAGRRLAGCVRAGDTVARLGGDEFTVVMPNVGSQENAALVASRIQEALARPFDLAGREAFVSGSIGITLYPADAGDAADMLKNADAAMYRAKEHGKANFQFFTQDMNTAIEERLAIKNGLTRAMERGELALHFQPKQDLRSGAVTGVEALLRWHAAELGEVSPSRFIPVMEEAGLMGRVGEWAIAAACRQHRAWREAGLDLRIAINLSVRQLRQTGFVEMVARSLSSAGVGPEALEFEITEDTVMKDAATAVAVLERLSAMGIRLAMDDFGTGYSSLSVIKRFPVESIKIDRIFIADMCAHAGGGEIIRTIINMGHSLGRRIVAEGVETREQRDVLAAMGCDEIQGYVLCPPLPAPELIGFLRSHRAG